MERKRFIVICNGENLRFVDNLFIVVHQKVVNVREIVVDFLKEIQNGKFGFSSGYDVNKFETAFNHLHYHLCNHV